MDQGKSAEGRWVLTNTTQLTAEQAQKVFDFIQENMTVFQEMADAEKKEHSRALARAYSILLSKADVTATRNTHHYPTKE